MSNQYITELHRMLINRYSVESKGMTTGEWLIANTTVRGKPFDFNKYEFQRQICDDLHPNMDVLKISQVGLTEIQQRKALAFCVRNPGVTGIFSLPNEKMYRKFAQTRLKPTIEDNKVFRPPTEGDPVKSIDTVQLGRSFLHVVNATEGSATATPADFIFTDEVDLSDQKALALFSSRLQNSEYKIKQRFSTPTWLGYGIDSGYSVSDQREFFCRCPSCNHWQVPLFSQAFVHIPGLSSSIDFIDINDETMHALKLEDAFVKCEKCGTPLDLDSTSREWVAKFPSRQDARGYRVRPFSSARISIPYIVTELLSYKRRDFIRGWHNTVNGEPYTDARARLDEAQIKKCMGSAQPPEISSSEPIGVGIDIGQTCHAVRGRMRGPDVHVFEFRSFHVNELESFIKETEENFNLFTGSTDRFPYTPTSEAVRHQTSGKVMPVEYRGSAELAPIKSVEDVITHWQADRTKLLDNLAKRIREKSIHFEGYGLQQTIVISHLRDQIREEDPEKPARWVKLTGVDHYSHALAFLLAGFRIRQIEANLTEKEVRQELLIGGLRIQSSGLRLAG